MFTGFPSPQKGQPVPRLHSAGVWREGVGADEAGAVQHTQPTQPLARSGGEDRDEHSLREKGGVG